LVDNLNSSELKDILRRLHILETTQPVGYTSVSEGALRIVSAEGLIVEGSESVTGTLTVSGTLTMSGTLNADGTITFTGPVTISGATGITGPLTVTGNTALNGDTTVNGPFHVKGATDITGDATVVGPFHVKGATDITGTLGIKGESTLEGDMAVTGGGKVTVGSMVLDPALSNGGAVGGLSAPVAIYLQAPTVATSGALFVGGTVSADNVSLAGVSSTTQAPNVYIDSFGSLFRVT